MVFFFKQKTAYEWRISDWSSDVCSSELVAFVAAVAERAAIAMRRRDRHAAGGRRPVLLAAGGIGHGTRTGAHAVPGAGQADDLEPAGLELGKRSAARSGGKECVSTCRTRWSPDH